MSKSESFDTLKAQLKRREKLYKSKISEESDELEEQSMKVLKATAIIGGGLAIGYGLFRILSGKKDTSPPPPEKKKVNTTATPSHKTAFLQSAIMDKLIAFALQPGFRYLSKKIRSNDEGDS